MEGIELKFNINSLYHKYNQRIQPFLWKYFSKKNKFNILGKLDKDYSNCEIKINRHRHIPTYFFKFKISDYISC